MLKRDFEGKTFEVISADMKVGKVKFFNPGKGYGFVIEEGGELGTSPDQKNNLFLHAKGSCRLETVAGGFDLRDFEKFRDGEEPQENDLVLYVPGVSDHDGRRLAVRWAVLSRANNPREERSERRSSKPKQYGGGHRGVFPIPYGQLSREVTPTPKPSEMLSATPKDIQL